MLSLLTKNAGGKVVVRLETALGVGIAGVASGSVTAKLSKNLGTAAAFTLSGANWTDIGDGMYAVTLAIGDTDTNGPGYLQITHLGVQSVWPILVRDTDEAALATTLASMVSTLATMTSTLSTISSTVATRASQGSLNSLQTSVNSLTTDVAAKASQSSVNNVQSTLINVSTDVTGIVGVLNAMDDNALTRMTVLTRADGSNGPVDAPLTARVYRWDNFANFNANGATGRTEYLVTCTYHASGRVDTFSKARV